MKKAPKPSFPKSITLKTLTIFDITAIVDIESEVSKNPWGSGLLIHELNKEGFIGLAACNSEEKIVGYALGQKVKDEFELRKIAVASENQNRGIGLMLTQELISRAKAQNIVRVFLEVGIDNIPAQNLYKKVGFKKISVREKYYNNKEDALILSKPIKKSN